MRDNFMDCPDRERRFYAGDATNEMEEVYYSLDVAGQTMAAKAIDNLVGFASPQGVLWTVSPHGDMELPVQQLAFITGVWDYYLHTGDQHRVVRAYPALARYLKLWTLGDDGLVTHRTGTWDWLDWGNHFDKAGIENAWYILACQSASRLAVLAGEDPSLFDHRAQTIRQAFREGFWDGSQYRSPGFAGDTDDRTNALAWLAGIAEVSQKPALARVFRRHFNASIYMEKYVLEALCQMGFADQALDRMQFRYQAMIDDPGTTLWEHWDKAEGSLNHGWSGGCLSVLSRYVLGVSPLEPGFSRFQIRPQLGCLRQASGEVVTVKGCIRVAVERGEASLTLTATVPPQTVALMTVPGLAPEVSGLRLVSRSRSETVFEAPAGAWTITTEVQPTQE